MNTLERINFALLTLFIKDYKEISDRKVRIKFGLLAGYISIITNITLFVVKIILGFIAGSISILADAFHLLSHLANSIVLVVSFWVASRPATAKTPFGYGRMEHVAPLIMAIFLFITGLEIGETSLHQILEPHPVHYWSTLPWILFATIVIKEVIGQFIRFLGKHIESSAILANAFHHRIEAIISITVIAGVIAGTYFQFPIIDGILGILVALWLFYLGFSHGREALIPILGRAPSKDMIQRIRKIAKSVKEVDDVHGIIIHDYGSMYLISLHAEISAKFSPEKMHEITEKCEAKLRRVFKGEVVCHTDPLIEKTSQIQAIEKQFKKLIKNFPKIVRYHGFRVVAESPKRIIIVADIDIAEDIPEKDYQSIIKYLEHKVKESIQNVAYSSFYATPKFAY